MDNLTKIQKAIYFLITKHGLKRDDIMIGMSPLLSNILSNMEDCKIIKIEGISITNTLPENKILVYYKRACYQENPSEYIVEIKASLEVHQVD